MSTFELDGISLAIAPLPLELAHAFGTSHSSTTTRRNALVTATAPSGLQGLGEAGLPPKKPHVYYADYDDCVAAFADLARAAASPGSGRDPTAPPCGDLAAAERALERLAEVRVGLRDPPTHRPLWNAVECALLDLAGRAGARPVHALLSLPHPAASAARSFVTVSLERDPVAFGASLDDALRATRWVKLKCDADLGYLEAALRRTSEAQAARYGASGEWGISVDANAAWTPEVAEGFLALLAPGRPLSPLRARIHMVEQPFPVWPDPCTGEDAGRWEAFRDRCKGEAGILVYADESVATAADIAPLSRISHGVNIKLDKAGGPREAARAAAAARAAGLSVWFGCMVSSRLACTAAGHLLSLATYGVDLDGEILVTPQSQPCSGGLTWDDGFVTLPCCPREGSEPAGSVSGNTCCY